MPDFIEHQRDSPPNSLPMATGYECGFRDIEPLEQKEMHAFLEVDGVCARCEETASPNWYYYSSIENYLPKNEVICEACCNEILSPNHE